MMRQAIRALVITVAACLSLNCSSGGSSSKGGSGGGGGIPAPPALVSLAVNPSSSSITVGDSVVLTCVGTYDDGSTSNVIADWDSTNINVVNVLGSSNGVTATFSGLAAGTASGRAVVGALSDICSFTVSALGGDPAPFYGLGVSGEIQVYSTQGTAPTTVAGVLNQGDSHIGFVMDPAGQNLYYALTSLQKFNIATAQISTVMTYLGTRQGIRFDSQGFLFQQDFHGGEIMKIDLSNNTETNVGSTGGTKLDFDFDSNDNIYLMPMISSAGSAYIYRNTLNNQPMTTFGQAPSNAVGLNGFYVPSGIASNTQSNRFYTGELQDARVWAYEDLNNDGDALDNGERAVFATLPIASGNSEHLLSGIAVASGGSLLVNVDPWQGGGSSNGVYWLQDLNNDGDCDETNEIQVYSTTHQLNNNGAQVIAVQK